MLMRHKALAAITACVLFWGFSFVSIKIAVVFLPPMTLGAIRFALGVVFLFFIKRKIAPGEKITGRDIPLLAGAGLTGVTLYFFFENNGVSLVPASEASIIIAAIPVITLIAERAGERISAAFGSKGGKAGGGPGERECHASPEAGRAGFGKRLLRRRLFRRLLPGAGALLSLAGVGLVAGVSFSLSGAAKGYIFMAGACVSWVAYCFLTRPLFTRRSRICIVFWQSVAGFLGFLPFALLEAASWKMPGLRVWGHVAFLGICCSALGYWFYALALEVLGVGTASIFINFIPVVTALAGILVLGERLEALQWLGAALVFTGVYLAMPASPGKRD